MGEEYKGIFWHEKMFFLNITGVFDLEDAPELMKQKPYSVNFLQNKTFMVLQYIQNEV